MNIFPICAIILVTSKVWLPVCKPWGE